MRQSRLDERALIREVHIHQESMCCRSGRCAGKAIELTWGGLRRCSVLELRKPRGDPIAVQESAEGIVGHAVGKASEALQSRKAEQQTGRAGNDDAKARTIGSGK